MAIALPTDVGPVKMTPRLLDWGSDQAPVLGGPLQRISRMGSRHAVDVEMPPMDYADAMAWVQRLKRGKAARVLMEFLQPGFDLTGYTNGTATGAGTSVAFTGIGKPLVEGQFFSLIIGGRRYLYSANAGGTTVQVEPMIRVPGTNVVAEVAVPMIEGALSGNEVAWTVDVAETVGLSFTITEAE